MHSLFRFTSRMPVGLDILMGDGFHMNPRDEEEENWIQPLQRRRHPLRVRPCGRLMYQTCCDSKNDKRQRRRGRPTADPAEM